MSIFSNASTRARIIAASAAAVGAAVTGAGDTGVTTQDIQDLASGTSASQELKPRTLKSTPALTSLDRAMGDACVDEFTPLVQWGSKLAEHNMSGYVTYVCDGYGAEAFKSYAECFNETYAETNRWHTPVKDYASQLVEAIDWSCGNIGEVMGVPSTPLKPDVA